MTNSYYFGHDYSASDDVKILFLRQELGMEGVGIFWYIIEKLAQAGGKLPFKVVPLLAMQMQVSDTKVKAVIQGFDLFIVEPELFFSQRLLTTIESYNQRRLTWSESGKRGMEKRWNKKDDGKKGMVL